MAGIECRVRIAFAILLATSVAIARSAEGLAQGRLLTQSKPLTNDLPIIVIDPGHGGRDKGAYNPKLKIYEKTLALQLGLKAAQALRASGRYRVLLTRTTDRFLVLQERYGVARRLKADVFISIHAGPNGVANKQSLGLTIYTLSDVASDKQSARFVMTENMSDKINGIDLGEEDSNVSSILMDLTQREQLNKASSLARDLGTEANILLPVTPGFHKFGAFMVLKAPDLPSVLLNVGDITDDRQANLVSSVNGQRKIATLIANGVDRFFLGRKK